MVSGQPYINKTNIYYLKYIVICVFLYEDIYNVLNILLFYTIYYIHSLQYSSSTSTTMNIYIYDNIQPACYAYTFLNYMLYMDQ